MKDILFLFPLFYTPNGVTRFAQYLREEEAPYTYGLYMPCSNSAKAPKMAARNISTRIVETFAFISLPPMWRTRPHVPVSRRRGFPLE